MKYTYQKLAHYEMNIWHWPEQLAAIICVISALTVMGPYDTYALPIASRLMYWSLCTIAGWTIMFASLSLVFRLRILDKWHGSGRVGFAMIMSVFPISLVDWKINLYFRPTQFDAEFWFFFINVCFANSLITILLYWRVSRRLDRMETFGKTGPAPFLERLPEELGRDLISLSMQGHYVEATTDKGSALILLRFGDALGELDGIDGVQIHRSHWIAQSAFCELNRDRGKLYARLSDDRSLPVSRTFARSARAFKSLREFAPK